MKEANEEIKKERLPKGEVRLLILFEMRLLHYLPNYLTYIIRKYVSGNLTLYFPLKFYFKLSHNQDEIKHTI